jgi:HECT-domain (ubiquitin-transferase)
MYLSVCALSVCPTISPTCRRASQSPGRGLSRLSVRQPPAPGAPVALGHVSVCLSECPLPPPPPRRQVVLWLWAIVHCLDAVEQRRFLKFFTGSDRAPIGGLGNLRCVIQRCERRAWD